MGRAAVRNAVVIGAVVLSGLLAGETGAAVRNPDGVAVIIGNRAYQYDVPQATYAHRDAAAFRRYVVDVLGFDPENVIHEKDADKATMERVFGNRDNLKGSELWRYLQLDGRSDVVVFYSGHGIPGLNDKRGYLLPVNAHPDAAELNGYPIDVLYENLVKLKEQKAARSVHVFLDACFSGDSGGGRLIGSTSAIRVAPLKDRMKSDGDSALAFKNQANAHKEKDDKSLRGYHKKFLGPFFGRSNRELDYDQFLRMYYRSFSDHFNPKLEYGEFVERTYRHASEDPSFPEKMAQDLWKLYRDTTSRDDFEKLIGLAPKHDGRDEGDPSNMVEEIWQTELEGIDRLTILTAASGEEVASWDKAAKHGLFTHHLLNALYGAGDADSDGQVTAAEAKAYLDSHMTRAARRTFGRVQNAELRGEGTAVLARAVGGMFPVRPLIGPVRQVGERFRDCPSCPEMVVVPAGSYQMGAVDGANLKGSGQSDARPVHQVTLQQPFAVGVYEVTRGEFRRFAEATGYSPGNVCQWRERRDHSWRNPGFAQTDQHPVVCVSWADAQAYVRWLSQETGQAYRLLSEAEWEYVARAGTRTARYWGQGFSDQCLHANGWDAAFGARPKPANDEKARSEIAKIMPFLSEDQAVECDDGYAWTSPVGVYGANAFGLHDMLGNVAEWVQDCWHPSYHGAPSDGRAWESSDCSELEERQHIFEWKRKDLQRIQLEFKRKCDAVAADDYPDCFASGVSIISGHFYDEDVVVLRRMTRGGAWNRKALSIRSDVRSPVITHEYSDMNFPVTKDQFLKRYYDIFHDEKFSHLTYDQFVDFVERDSRKDQTVFGQMAEEMEVSKFTATPKFKREYYDAYQDKFQDIPFEQFEGLVENRILQDPKFLKKMGDDLYTFYRHKMSRAEFDAEFLDSIDKSDPTLLKLRSMAEGFVQTARAVDASTPQTLDRSSSSKLVWKITKQNSRNHSIGFRVARTLH